MPDVMEQQDVYLSSFRALESGLAAKGPPWLHQVRREAIQRFAQLGFPTTLQEEWRFTNVAPIAKISFHPASEDASAWTAEDLEPALLEDSLDIRLVFVNGQYCEEASSVRKLPSGVKAGSLARALQGSDGLLEEHLARYADYRNHPFLALNTAFWQDGAYLRIPKGTVIEKPIHILFVSTADGAPLVSYPRSLILADRDSQVTLIESYVGLSGGICFSNAVSEIVASENTMIHHYKLQIENKRSYHIATLQVHQNRSANFSSCSVSLGGALVRNEVNAVLDAEGAECALNGLYMAQDRQLVDNRTVIDHAKPHGTSRQLYNGILDGHATGVFNGRIIVRPDAKKTDAIQKNRNLLLSEDAVINTKPQLEIFANDVRCTHGATIGQMDPEALFYLWSRGIGPEEARNILIYAFAGEIFERIRSAPVRGRAEDMLRALLSHGSSSKEVL